MLKFSFRDYEVPPDRLRFRAPDGTLIEATDQPAWYAKIRKHYADNSLPLPANYKELAQDHLCRILPPGWCRHEDGTGAVGVNVRLVLGDYLRGMEILTAVATSGDPLVSAELAEERAAKCAACPANVAVPGCAPCVGISNLIVKIKGANTTKADPFLKTCACCKCNTAAKVWVKTEILSRADDATVLAQMRSMPDCWCSQEIDSLNQ